MASLSYHALSSLEVIILQKMGVAVYTSRCGVLLYGVSDLDNVP